MAEIVYKEESYRIIGACFAVYNAMGSGFLESVYQECMRIELRQRDIPYLEQPEVKLWYLGLLINFGHEETLQYERLVHTSSRIRADS